ncbi:MAG: YbhN family protein [Phycisphaerales bacterium]|nr:YbhN family protein [Phycisphaerales bacterium]
MMDERGESTSRPDGAQEGGLAWRFAWLCRAGNRVRTALNAEHGDAKRDAMLPGMRSRLLLKIVGFILGLGLLAWVIQRAVSRQQFSGLTEAAWWQFALLLLCTVVSVLANGAIFWTIIRPAAPLGFWPIQAVNAAVSLVNYSPVRIGVALRFVHHRRVDDLPYPLLLAWYACFALLMFMTLGCVLGATLLRPAVDAWWGAALLALLAAGGAAAVWAGSHRLLESRWRGASQILAAPGAVGGAILLRLVDMIAYGGRLYIAITILGTTVTPRDAVVLTVLSMVSSLSPVGSVGLREFAVAWLGPMLADASLAQHIDAAVLVDRAAEVLIVAPAGALGLLWIARAWRSGKG